jgi:uncharacterized protein (TIRG00374 family)
MTQLTYKAKTIFQRLAKSRWVFRLIGLGLFVLILLRIDLGETLRLIGSLDMVVFALSMLALAAGLVVTTYRWQFISKHLDIWLPFGRTFILQLIGTTAALSTPGQLGEFVKVLYYRSYGYPVGESFLSVFFDRLFDLLLLLILSFVALAALFGVPPTLIAVMVTLGLLFLVLAFLFTRYQEQSAQWIARAFAYVTPKAYQEVVHLSSQRLARRVVQFDVRLFSICGLLSLLNYSFLLLRAYLVIVALHVRVPFWYFALILPLLRIVGLIPISILGIGTRDVTAIYLFSLVGVSQETALSLSVLMLASMLLQALVGLWAWWKNPLQAGMVKEGLAFESQPETARRRASALKADKPGSGGDLC